MRGGNGREEGEGRRRRCVLLLVEQSLTQYYNSVGPPVIEKIP